MAQMDDCIEVCFGKNWNYGLICQKKYHLAKKKAMNKQECEPCHLLDQEEIRRPLIWADEDVSIAQAEHLAQILSLSLTWQKPSTPGLVLHLRREGVELFSNGDAQLRQPFYVDFYSLAPRVHHAKIQQELLIRAAKVQACTGDTPPILIDATAGFGEDGFLFAAAGFQVTLCEQNVLIAFLLQEALTRSAQVPELAHICQRLSLHRGDSVDFLLHLDRQPAVVYLDPMFPARQKNAKIKKKLQIMQLIEQPCPSEQRLFAAALSVLPQKIVVKRPVKGPSLAGLTPAFFLKGKAVRFDVYLPRSMSAAVRNTILQNL